MTHTAAHGSFGSMNFAQPLSPGKLIKRYKRFFADIEVGGKILVAHVPNTGSLKGCLEEGQDCLFSHANDPSRKLQYTLQMIKYGSAWIGVNTGLANDLVFEAFQSGQVPGWKRYDAGIREFKVSEKSRLDLAIWKSTAELPIGTKWNANLMKKNKFHFVEVKNTTMAHGQMAMFPDAVTERGQKHLEELIKLQDSGHKAEILFLVQRTDCKLFAPADAIDPAYGHLLRKAIKAGVKVSAYPCEMSATEVKMIPKALALEI